MRHACFLTRENAVVPAGKNHTAQRQGSPIRTGKSGVRHLQEHAARLAYVKIHKCAFPAGTELLKS